MNRFIGLNDVKEAPAKPANPYLGMAELAKKRALLATVINALTEINTEDVARIRLLLQSQITLVQQAVQVAEESTRHTHLFASVDLSISGKLCADECILVYESELLTLNDDTLQLQAIGFKPLQFMYFGRRVCIVAARGNIDYTPMSSPDSIMGLEGLLRDMGYHIYDGIPF